MSYDKENVHTATKLQKGEVCLVQGFGNSMVPLLKSGQVCEVTPVTDETCLEKGDIVFCKVNGFFYLHKITALKKEQYQISNNHGHVNGWVTRKNIYGLVTKTI